MFFTYGHICCTLEQCVVLADGLNAAAWMTIAVKKGLKRRFLENQYSEDPKEDIKNG